MSSHTKFQLQIIYVLNLRYRPHYFKCKDLYYTPQNHSTTTITSNRTREILFKGKIAVLSPGLGKLGATQDGPLASFVGKIVGTPVYKSSQMAHRKPV